MSVLSNLVRGVRNVIRSEDLWGAWARGDEDLAPLSVAGVKVTRETAQAISAVWACRNLIASTVASLPADVLVRDGTVRRPVAPAPDWLDRPNPEQGMFELVWAAMDSMLLDGTAYFWTPRDRLGGTLQVWPVDPRHVRPRRELGRVLYDVYADEQVQGTLEGGIAGEMFHIAAYAPAGALKGMAPLEVARTMLGGGLAAQEFSARFFGQGMHMAGVIEEAGDLSIEQARELKRDFARANSGLRNAHLPAVLTGTAKWKPQMMTAEQAQFIETRRLSKEDIATFFLVPPYKIGVTTEGSMSFASTEQQSIDFFKTTLLPWVVRTERGFTRYLLWDRPGAYFQFNVEGLLRGSVKERYEALAIKRQWGALSADEWRALDDDPPLPSGLGRTYLQPSTHLVVGRENDGQEA